MFKDCYIEASGECGLEYRVLHISSFNFMWLIQWFQPNTTVTIYDSKAGTVLWSNNEVADSNIWATQIFFFKEDYTITHSTVTLAGTTKVMLTCFDG